MAGLYAANLAEMRGKVRDWADTAVISDGVIDDFINIAVGRLAKLVRIRQFEKKVSSTIVVSEADGSFTTTPWDDITLTWDEYDHVWGQPDEETGLFVTIPSDYLETKSLRYVSGNGTVFLERKSLDKVEELSEDPSGCPQYFARKLDTLVLGPPPENGGELELIYWYDPPILSEDSDTNWFITGSTTAVLYGALVELGVYTSDLEFSTSYDNKFMASLTEVQAVDDKENWSGSTLSVSISE